MLGKIRISCWIEKRTEMRVGEISREKCWKRFTSLAGKNRHRIPRSAKISAELIPDNFKETCKSVNQEPLLPGIDLDKFNGEPMHVAQGLLTHQNSEVFKKLNEESDNPDGEYFYSQAELCQQYIMDTIELEKSVEFMDAKKVNSRIQKEIIKAMDALIVAEESKNKR